MTSVVRFNRSIEHKDVCRLGTSQEGIISTHTLDLMDGGVGLSLIICTCRGNLPYQVKSFFSTDKSILLTLIENLYFTLLLIRQKMDDRDCLDCMAI